MCIRDRDIHFLRKINDDLLKRHYPDTMALEIGKKAQNAIKNIDDPITHGRKVLRWLRKYVQRGPVIALKIGGEEAIKVVRRVTGYTDPSTAEEGTIRRELGIDSLKKATEENRSCENLIHASGNREEAQRELLLWFPE